MFLKVPNFQMLKPFGVDFPTMFEVISFTLGPYGFQIFSINSWDSKASCDNESFGGSVFFSPKAVGHQSVVLGLSPASAYKAWIIWDYSDSNETVILEYPNSSQQTWMVWVNGLLQSPI